MERDQTLPVILYFLVIAFYIILVKHVITLEVYRMNHVHGPGILN